MKQESLMELANKISKKIGPLGNPNRVKIILLCSQKPYTVSELAQKLNISISRVSNNLTVLENAGLIKRTKNKDNTVLVESLIKINEDIEILNV